MGEWVRDTSGTALKTTDWMLEEGLRLITENALLRLQNEQLREELAVAMECALVR